MRILVLVALLACVACGPDEHQRAAERGRAGAEATRKAMAEKATLFKNSRADIIAKVKGQMAAKDWDAAALEASKWREIGDTELIQLDVAVERERDKIYQAKQVEENKKNEAVRLVAERERALIEKADRARRKKQGVHIGMTASEVQMSSWGRPEKVNRSVYSFGVHEQWVYGSGNYLYFEDDKLTSIQQSN
jgi:hypothetical protein